MLDDIITTVAGRPQSTGTQESSALPLIGVALPPIACVNPFLL
jgi:hypothetical protein